MDVLRPQGRYQRRRPAVARGAFRKQPLRLKSRSRSAGLATFRPRVHRPPVSSKLSKATSIFRSRTDPGQGRPGARAPGASMVQREPQERRGQRASWTYCSLSPKVRAGNDARDQPDTDGRTGRARCPRSLSLLARSKPYRVSPSFQFSRSVVSDSASLIKLINVHRVGDAIQPSHRPSSPSLAFSLSQHQGLFK